ncbi:hypothetical protein NQZ68_036921, partial [Dissostichus eleginoides]
WCPSIEKVLPVGEMPRRPATESVQQGEPIPGWPEGGHQKKPVAPMKHSEECW